MNKIDDAVKAAEKELPSNLSWDDAIKSYGDEAISLWRVSGRVAANDPLTAADRYRLADVIIKKQQTSTTKENTMTSTDENMFTDENRPYLLAAQKHRAKLQKSDTEDLFSIARRLRTQVETARTADAAQPRPETEVFDASAHRPGFRDGTQWRHDRRKRRTTEEYDPEGRQQATYVSTSEEEDDPEKSLSDARNAYLEYVGNAYKQGK